MDNKHKAKIKAMVFCIFMGLAFLGGAGFWIFVNVNMTLGLTCLVMGVIFELVALYYVLKVRKKDQGKEKGSMESYELQNHDELT
jgi:membrane protein implicated in regulation of membrane protease activity